MVLKDERGPAASSQREDEATATQSSSDPFRVSPWMNLEVAFVGLPLLAATVGFFPAAAAAVRAGEGIGTAGWRLLAALLLVGMVIGLGRRLRAGFAAEARRSWWDPADEPDGSLSWDGLLVLVRPPRDPMVNEGSVRRGVALRHAVRLVLACLFVLSLALVMSRWIAAPELPAFLATGGEARSPVDALINLSGNLTALLALVAAAASIRFADRQLRAKVRADNRQEWLSRTRALLAEAVGMARSRTAATDGGEADADDVAGARALDSRRLRFELMLNPREKDHRLLMHLLRMLAFPGDHLRAERADGGAFLETLRAEGANRDRAAGVVDPQDAWYLREWAPIVECRDAAALTTYVMRLGHVVLKREWERVKAAR